MSEPRPAKRTRDDAGTIEAQSRPSKRNVIFPVATFQPERSEGEAPDEAFLDHLDEPRLCTPPIETLPQELLLEVFEHFVHPSLVTAGFPEQHATHYTDDFDLGDGQPNQHDVVSAVDRRDLRNLCLVSRTFKMAATTLLYRCAHFTTAESPGSLLFALTAHPDLQPLVRHISVPTYRRLLSKNFSFAFLHDTYSLASLKRERPVNPGAHFFAGCEESLSADRLRLTVSLVPNLRTLVITQVILLDGPFTKDLVLRNLTKLRINLTAPNEVIFVLCGQFISDGTLTWLSPDFIGHRFPALQRLEISTPHGRWEADIVSEEADSLEGSSPLKYVESLKTKKTYSIIPAEWDLMSLEQPIFHPSKLRTLDFGGPGENCAWVIRIAKTRKWDLNRLFAEKGGGLRALSLDWEVHDYTDFDEPTNLDLPQLYFGPEGRLHTLDKLTNLTYLTTSLQAFFGIAKTFWDWVDDMEASPEKELARLLPPSLRTLRIAEYIPGVYEGWWDIWEYEDEAYQKIRNHGRCVCRFLQALRTWWLSRDEGRELWFRRNADLDQLEVDSGAPLGRSGIEFILDYETERDERFERVLRPEEDGDNDDNGNESDEEEATGGSDDGTTENEDQNVDGGSEQ